MLTDEIQAQEPLQNEINPSIIIEEKEFQKLNKGDIKMDTPLNANYIVEKRRDDACLEVGLEGIASSHRAGLAAEASSQRGFNHAGGTAQRMAIAELDATNRVASDVCGSSRDILKDIHDSSNHVSSAVERSGDKIQSDICESSRDIMKDIHDSSNHVTNAVQRSADKTQAEVERFGLSELEAIRDAEKYLYAGMSQNAKEALLEFERTKLLISSNTKDLLLQAASNAKDAALASCELQHQADKNTAAVQLEAFRHKEELARQIAECCCEQKSLTIEKAAQTQDLIRESEKDRLKDERDKLREELIALRVRASLPPPLTGSIPL